MPTAAAMGRKSVARKVVTMAMTELAPVRTTILISSTLTELTAAKMRIAASVGIATRPTSPENSDRIASIQTPEKIDAHRVRAPAAALSAVWPTEPPTGWPRNRPAARLAMPCALKSPFVSAWVPSGLGAASATPAPCTSTITAMTTAPESTAVENSRRSGGRCGNGTPVGMSPMSATVTTLGRATASALGMSSAATDAYEASRVLVTRSRTANVTAPTSRELTSIPAG